MTLQNIKGKNTAPTIYVMRTTLEIIRDGKRTQKPLLKPLENGEEGNLQTLAEMARIVREDRFERDLRNFVVREIVGDGVSGHDFAGEIKKCFEFAQKQIVYRRDPAYVERIADLWSAIYALDENQPEGDCGVKSTVLATCLALLGHVPFFCAINQHPSASSFSHVYVAVLLDGKLIPLDPTPNDKPLGWEANYVKKLIYPIFEEKK